MVDTSDDWIVQRTGIKERHIAGDDETTATLGLAAAKAALADAATRRQRYRSHRPRDLDARPHVSGDRDGDPVGARHHPWRRVRSCRRCAPGFVFAHRDGRQIPYLGLSQTRARDRLGDLLAHSRLDGSRHMRPVRRWSRRGGARGARESGRRGRAGRDHHASALGRASQRRSSMSMAAPPRRRRSAICAWRARRCSGMRSA